MAPPFADDRLPTRATRAPYSGVPIIPLHGHAATRARLRDAFERGALPASLLFHGPRGVGKQRLALWLGQLLLCDGKGDERPCGRCQSCRYALELAHPDLLWFFPRPRPKDADPAPAEVRADFADAAIERLKAGGLYAPPSGSEGIFVSMIRAIVTGASLSPAFGRRKVFVVGDAERMVPQEGSEFAANAFLKLLEEPPEDTTILLTTSEPGALLPTIRSRVVCIRVPSLPDDEVRAFVEDERVAKVLAAEAPSRSSEEWIRIAGGAPGVLLDSSSRRGAEEQARRILEAVDAVPAERYAVAFSQGVSGARGGFSDALEALTGLLHERVRGSVERGDGARAVGAARAVDAVERARERAHGNANPQVVTAELLRELAEALR
jgi:DNA polymerase III subunit delta'